MRSPSLAILVAVTLMTSTAAAAQDMSNMPGMAAPAHADGGKRGQGVGVIQAIDPAARTLTVKHGPIPAVGWPAMTMTFKVEPSVSMAGLAVGQPVGFDLTAQGMSGEITALRPQS